MKALLAKKLVEKGAIRENTEFEAYFNAHSLSCSSSANLLGKFCLKAVTYSKSVDTVTFVGLYNNSQYKFTNTAIISLDGMPPDRIAPIYGLSSCGEDLKVGKQRGRKSYASIQKELALANERIILENSLATETYIVSFEDTDADEEEEVV